MNPCSAVGHIAQLTEHPDQAEGLRQAVTAGPAPAPCQHLYAYMLNRPDFVRTCVHCKAEEPLRHDPRSPGVVPLELVGWPGLVAPFSVEGSTPPAIAREHREALLRRIAQRAGEAAQASRDLHTALAQLAAHDRAYTLTGEYRG